MAEQEYKSIYTGEEVDEGVGLAQTAVQQTAIVQETGANTDKVMSQAATTIALNQKATTSAITNAITIHNASETAHPFIQEQFADYIPLAQKGVADGVAELDSSGKIPSSQIPVELNDVIDSYIVGATALASDWLSLTVSGSALTPETGKIYIVLTSGEYQNVIYRWNGTASYVAISVRDLINKLDKVTATSQTVTSAITFNGEITANNLISSAKQDTIVTTDLTLAVVDWSTNEQTKALTHGDGDSLFLYLPTLSTTSLTLANNLAFATANIIIKSSDYSADTITLYAETAPTAEIIVSVEVRK